MKFYEYSGKNGAAYYALIAADTEESANGEYEEEVSEIDDDFSGPTEITEEQAREKFENGMFEEGTNGADFDVVTATLPEILLIDSDLA